MKTYARIEGGHVVELFQTDEDIATLFHPDLIWIDCTAIPGVRVGWSYNGAAFSEPPAPPAPSEKEVEAQAGAAVRAMLDQLAQSWDYSSYISARAYKGDVSPKFDAEGTALANYGSACYTKLEQIKAGTIARPADLAGLLALMPPAPIRPVVS